MSCTKGSGGSAAWNPATGSDGGGNLDADPLFVTPVPVAPSAAGDLHLRYTSPAINTGSNTVANPSLPATDRDGNPRIVGASVDMGAYESAPSPIYVKAGASGSGDGSSWAKAYPQLASALSAATPGDQIWVAAGTYRPTPGSDRTASFALKNGLAIYGGFAGTETLLTDRDWTANVVTLSGDLLGNDVGFTNNAENSYHIITMELYAQNGILDGVTVSGGNANGEREHAVGGGVRLSDRYSSLMLANVVISGNHAFHGGGVYDENSVILTNVVISGNTADYYGGGMYSDGWSPVLTNVTISGNTAHHGGGLLMGGTSPALTNVVISGNMATDMGGGMHTFASTPVLTNMTISGNTARNGGGLSLGGSSPALTNLVISGNTATELGGGMYSGGWSPVLTNVTLSGNTARNDGGGGIFNASTSSLQIRNSILWSNSSGISNTATTTPTISFSLVQGSGGSAAWDPATGTDGGGNLDTDPLFVTPVPAAPSSGGNLRLQDSSPALDAGSNTVASPSLPATDYAGNPRIVATTVDMGAYEHQGWFTSQLPAAATYGSTYTHTFAVAGDTTPITFTLTAGSLPPGLTLSPSGVLSGIPTAAGSYPNLAITASNGTDSMTQMVTLTVTPAPLTITANDLTRPFGQANPDFTVQYSGFVLGEDSSVLSSPPVLSTTATPSSPAGSYPITPSGASAANYTITFVPGTLTVTAPTDTAVTSVFLPLVLRP